MKTLIFLLSLLLTGVVQAADKPPAVIALFQQHCIKCHGRDGKAKGEVNLLTIRTTADLTANLEQLQTLIEVLDAGEMPPEKEPSLPPGIRTTTVKQLRQLLQTATLAKGFASTPIRRMNRFQYSNAVQDLFDLKVMVFPLPERMMRDRSGYFQKALNVADRKMPKSITVSSRMLGKSALIEPRLAGVGPFPQDLRADHGFDNRGDHLSLSPMLMEAFFMLSRRIVQSPNFDGRTVGIWKTFFVPPPGDVDVNTEVRKRLRKFLARAFRQPLKDDLLERYVRHVTRRIESGITFTEAMKEVASATLASPRFLYLYDKPVPASGKASPDGYNLASRLSFFLWGSIPDEELLRVAGSGKLAESNMLAKQVERLLGDKKLKRFCDSFPSQWLQLDRIVSSVPDEETFADFYYAPPNYRTSMDMMMEPLLLFETVLIENRSILEFIDSNYAYRSARLRKWYGDKVDGKLGGPVTMQFSRQPVTDRRQGGMITTAAVMTMTSSPDETKPITRGAWLASVIFNAPPDPPPANVPPLQTASEGEGNNMTLRERFAVHRENAACAGCHAKLDPLGFALENFDPVGRWRDHYENGRQVDSSGTLFRKHKFTNVVEFKDAILAEKDRFTRAFAEHMLSFALGREATAADAPALDLITTRTRAADYHLQTLIHEVTQSAPFLSNPRTVVKKKPRPKD
ncbi:MAG: DUF1592 domain-containing protein [Pirellulaceae bacterium]